MMKIKILYFSILLILTAHFFFKLLSIDYSTPLGGVENIKDNKIIWEYSSFFDGSNQTKLDNSTRENIGLYNFLIRLRNQINFQLFRKVNRSVILKNGAFVQEQYINTLYGVDLVEEKRIETIKKDLEFISDTLKKINKGIVFVIAPNKARLYQNEIPDHLVQSKKTTNYDRFINMFKTSSIEFIDFIPYFENFIDTCRFPAFTKYATHWSGYSSPYVGDSLFSYIYKKLEIPYEKIQFVGVDSSYTSRFTDYDLGALANVFSLPDEHMYYYPKLVFKAQKKKPKIVIVADSFGQSFYGFNQIYDSLMSPESQYWFYNKQIDWPGHLRGVTDSEFDLRKKYDDTDYYVIMVTEPDLVSGFIYKFTEQLRVYLQKGTILGRFNEAKIVKKIKNNKKWLASVEEKAIKNNIPLDIQLTLDAIWVFKKDTAYLNIHKKISQQIKSNPKTLAQMKEKAKGNKIPLDVQLEIDILWIIKNKY